MSQREFMIVLAHAHVCGTCRARLLSDASAVFAGRPLTAQEKGLLAGLKVEHFLTPDALARAGQCTTAELATYEALPVVRLRHL